MGNGRGYLFHRSRPGRMEQRFIPGYAISPACRAGGKTIVTKYSRALVSYRKARANETMEDARILANAGRWNACVNRLYYSCFYGVSALFVRHGLSSSKHTGVRSLFNRHYSDYLISADGPHKANFFISFICGWSGFGPPFFISMTKVEADPENKEAKAPLRESA